MPVVAEGQERKQRRALGWPALAVAALVLSVTLLLLGAALFAPLPPQGVMSRFSDSILVPLTLLIASI